MTQRVTMKEIYSLVEWISELTGDNYGIDHAYGAHKLVIRHADTSESEISPRLPKSQLYEWLHAYKDGIYKGMKLSEKNK